MSVAGSQSNTLNDGEIRPSVAQLSSQDAMSSSDERVLNNCVKCAKLRYVRCAECLKSVKASGISSSIVDEGKTHTECVQSGLCENVQCTVRTHAVCTQNTSTAEYKTVSVSGNVERTPFLMAGRRIKTKFDLSKVGGGRFILKSTMERGGGEGAFMNNVEGSDDRNTGTAQVNMNIISLSSEGGESKNPCNIINIMRTPKRKKASAVSELVSKFSGASANQPGFGNSESPAKRRRLWGQGGQGH